jgi:hypothetical protein
MTKTAHDQLMELFREYFRLNQEWESKETHASGMRVRKALSDMRSLASARRKEIQAVRVIKPKVKSPKYKANQKRQAEDDSDTN